MLQTSFANNMERLVNTWILERIATDLHLRSGVVMRMYKYFGHIVRKDGRIEKQILQGAVEGKQAEGHINVLDRHEKNCQEMVCMVHHTLQWREMVGVLF